MTGKSQWNRADSWSVIDARRQIILLRHTDIINNAVTIIVDSVGHLNCAGVNRRAVIIDITASPTKAISVSIKAKKILPWIVLGELRSDSLRKLPMPRVELTSNILLSPSR